MTQRLSTRRAIEQTQEPRTDLLLVDRQLPETHGFEVATRLSQLEVPAAVL
jgi:CheY-like chemotaxis protein